MSNGRMMGKENNLDHSKEDKLLWSHSTVVLLNSEEAFLTPNMLKV